MFKKIVYFTALSLFLLSGNAFSKKITLNLGYAGAEGCTYSVLADKFEELVEKYTDNTVDVKVRCCTQLATEDEAFKAMQLGTVDMYIITSNNISPHFPLMDAFVLPYIFQSKEHTYKVLEGEIGKKFAEDLRKATSVYLLTYGFVGHRDFYNSVRPIHSMKDMEGIKIRVPKNQVMIETFRAFGAAPIPLAWAETPTALQTGTVQGGDNGTSFIKSQKFYELADYLAILEHFSYFSPLFASPRAIGKLSDDQKKAVFQAADEAGVYHRQEMQKQVSEIRDFLATEGGMEVTYPEKKEFIQAAIQVQDAFLADKDEEFKNLVEEIRAAAK